MKSRIKTIQQPNGGWFAETSFPHLMFGQGATEAEALRSLGLRFAVLRSGLDDLEEELLTKQQNASEDT